MQNTHTATVRLSSGGYERVTFEAKGWNHPW